MTLGDALENHQRDIAGLEIWGLPGKAENLMSWLDKVETEDSDELRRIEAMRSCARDLIHVGKLSAESKRRLLESLCR